MSQEPTNVFKSGGKLRDCDICGFTMRESQMFQDKKGLWRCPTDTDKPSVRDYEKEEIHYV